MAQPAEDTRLQEHVFQLNAIVARRNEFLRELFRMMRNSQDINATAIGEDDEDLQVFLQRFDLEKDLDHSSITNLTEDEISFPIRKPGRSISPLLVDANPSSSVRNIRSRSLAVASPSPILGHSRRTASTEGAAASEHQTLSPSRDAFSPKPSQQDADSDEDNDELDLLRSRVFPTEGGRPPSKPLPETNNAAKYLLPLERKEQKEGFKVPIPEGVPLLENECLTYTRNDVIPVDAIVHPEAIIPPQEILKVEDDMKVDLRDYGGHTHPETSKDEIMDVEEDEVEAITQAGDIEAVEDSANFIETVDTRNYIVDSTLEVDAVAISQKGPVTPAPPPIKYIPIEIIFPPSIHKPILIPTPTAAADEKPFKLDITLEPETQKLSSSDTDGRQQFNPNYALPALNVLPSEFTRKAKPIKRKKDKDREREKEKEREGKRDKDDAVPMGLARWGATLSANPVWKKVSRASKCLSTREWSVAMAELRLIRTIDRINALKDDGRWSFRQPKKQRGVGGLVKSHWDYLIEEMKWMRIDFREERRWKMALAYNLSTAVLEWHYAKTPEERQHAGIVVKWRPPHLEDNEDDLPESVAMDISQDDISIAEKPAQALLGVDYGSDDDDDDEPEKARSVVDSLEPAAVIQDALDNISSIQPKSEEVDDPTVLQLIEIGYTQDATLQLPSDGGDTKPDASQGLKSTSENPVLGGSKSSSQSTNGDADALPISSKLSKSTLAPLRERVAYDDALFLNLAGVSPKTTIKSDPHEPEFHETLDLTALFPDLQPLGILEVSAGPALCAPEGKRKAEKKSDRDDPTKRPEDTTYTKLYPAGRFMYTKPTLIGPLQPAKRYKDGKWLPTDPSPVAADVESSNRITEESNNELFDGRPSTASSSLALQTHAFSKDARKRGADHLWSSADDLILKQLVERYSTNWSLVAECYNSSRLTTPTERRTPVDCAERWKERWGVERRVPTSDVVPTSGEDGSPAGTSSQMTTRGVKRLASASISSAQGPPMGSEPKKRRRHYLLQDSIKRAAKKRADAIQKMLANQRKLSTVHETHNQFNKLPKLTPLELARMKADRDQRESHDMQVARRRQEETLRQNLMREQAQRLGTAVAPNPQPQVQQQQQLTQQQPQQVTQQPPPQPQVQAQQVQQVLAQQQQLQQQQLAQLQQLQAQQQANQAGRANATAGATLPNRPARLTATTNARPVGPQLQAQLLLQARAMQVPMQLPAGAQANLTQALSQAQAAGNPTAGNSYYQLPGNIGNLTQEQLLNAFAMQSGQHAQQQNQQPPQGQAAPSGFANQS